MKSWDNQVQKNEAKEEKEVFMEEEAVTNDVEDEVGASTSQHTRHQFETSKKK